MYVVFLEDEYMNNWFIGVYKKLEDSLEDVNKELATYGKSIDCLTAHSSTFDECFDTEIELDEGMIMIRGFYIENIQLKEEINE